MAVENKNIVIDNAGFLAADYGTGTAGFTPAISFSYDSVGESISVQDDSTYPAGDGIAAINVTVADHSGAKVHGQITVTGVGGAINLDVSGLDPYEGFSISAHITTDLRKKAVLSAYEVGSETPKSGNLRFKNVTGG